MGFEVRDENFEQRVRDSFALQIAMQSLGMEISEVEPGLVVLEMPFNPEFTQQHGFHHAGIATTGMDSACGYAAFSLMDADAEVLTVEFKTNFLAPAMGDRFRFCGEVIKPGRTLTICEGKAYALNSDASPKLIANMSATMIAVYNQS